jgi:MarR family transcriptional regulator for hemolysin
MENLNEIFFYHLDKSIKTYRQFAQEKLKENGFKITIDQWLVLKAVSNDPDISHNDLAEAVFKDKASVTRIIELLVKSSYLKSAVHPDSGRKRKLTVTKKADSLLNEIRPFVLKNRKTALKDISTDEIAIAEKVLKRISANCKRKK